MAVFLTALQYHGQSDTNGNFLMQVSYLVGDSVAQTSVCAISPVIQLPLAQPQNWWGSIVSGVIADAGANGYTVTSASSFLLQTTPGDPVGRPYAVWTKDVTKTNIGTNYVNVYNTTNGEAQSVCFTTNTQFRFVVYVNKIGTGTQDAALVDVTSGSRVVVSDGTAAGEHTLDSGWQNLPSWGNSERFVKPTVRSSVAADDPVYHSFLFYLR